MSSLDTRLSGALRTAADAASARAAAPPARQVVARGRRRRRVRVGATVTVTACLAIAVGVAFDPGRRPRPVGPADAPTLTGTTRQSAAPGPGASATPGPAASRTPPTTATITDPPVPSNTPARP
ncbi:hypothetical protein [Kitasatospora sp. CB01950]|uniref:hypothetical protein n=1 Tax=Kitasatospora sp. CB01950 TaxID=1703930 RepID=UPI00093DBF15|nr:hypothetical protein [Kitasatospora sp. CB01950]OKJ17291.1 hypothetical protein AMK19_04255 [Kitasatospora sp. CB01950]